jgi:hypothetical protein
MNKFNIRYFHNSVPTFQRPDHPLYRVVDWSRVDGGDYAVVNPQDPAELLYLHERDYVVQIRVSMTQNHRLVTVASPGQPRVHLPGEQQGKPVDPTVAQSSVKTETGTTASVPDQGSSEKDPDKVPTTAPKAKVTPPQSESSWFYPSSRTSSKNSPPRDAGLPLRAFKKMFGTSFFWVKKVRQNSESKAKYENLVVVTEGNLLPLFASWAFSLWARIEGLRTDQHHRSEIRLFSEYLLGLLRRHGISHLILRLKVLLFVVNSFAAGTKLRSTQDLGIRVRLTNGLPQCLPTSVRLRIRNHNLKTIRLWSSILYVYKAMSGPHLPPKFSLITKSTPEGEYFYDREFKLFTQFAPEFAFWIKGKVHQAVIKAFTPIPRSLFAAPSAGPNFGFSLGSSPLDALWWAALGWTPSNPLRRYMETVGDVHGRYEFENLVRRIITLWFPSKVKYTLLDLFENGKPFPDLTKVDLSPNVPSHYTVVSTPRRKSAEEKVVPKTRLKSLCGGRLAALKEAAGKVRIIAIVDNWSQTYLTPIHNFLFSILRKTPCDATFDQQGAVSDFAKKGHKDIMSFDLTAATDTIPWTLYKAIMRCILGEAIADSWLALLRDRDWLLPLWDVASSGKPQMMRLEHEGNTTIRYVCGQPMGARSSWPALAIVHHALVQFAAWKCGCFPFADYLILGDDIVIANKSIAEHYRRASSHLGVIIGLPKSFASSEGFFNFANQSYLGENNLSPISFKEELATGGLYDRFESLTKAIDKGWLDPEATNFFSKCMAWFLNPNDLRRMERSRKSGLLHKAIEPVSNLIFSSILGGRETFKMLKGFSVQSLVDGMVNPRLRLFTIGLGQTLTRTLNKKAIWSSEEYAITLMDRMIHEVGRVFLERGNILRTYIGLPTTENLEPIPCPDPKGVIQMEKDLVEAEGSWRQTGMYGFGWMWVAQKCFTNIPSVPNTIKLANGDTVTIGNKDREIGFTARIVEWFGYRDLLDIAKVSIPRYNFLLARFLQRGVKTRKLLVSFPHAVLDMANQETNHLTQLSEDVGVGPSIVTDQRSDHAVHNDRKIVESLLLSDAIRQLADLQVKGHSSSSNYPQPGRPTTSMDAFGRPKPQDFGSGQQDPRPATGE